MRWLPHVLAFLCVVNTLLCAAYYRTTTAAAASLLATPRPPTRDSGQPEGRRDAAPRAPPRFVSTLPVTLPGDLSIWRTLRTPFNACTWSAARDRCTWPVEDDVLVTYHNVSVARHDLGVCGGQGAASLRVRACEPRAPPWGAADTFVPLHVPQGGYFAHFMDGVLPKLVRVLDAVDDASRILVYLDGSYRSADTLEILRRLGVSFTFQYPAESCFRRVVWACKAPGIARELWERARFYARKAAGLGADDGGDAPCQGGVYLSRRRNTRNGRHVRNEAALEEWALARGLSVLDGTEPFAAWTQVVRASCFMIGAHGTALAKLFWLPRSAVVVELDGHGMYRVFWAHASALGLKYMWLAYDRERGVDLLRLATLVHAASA